MFSKLWGRKKPLPRPKNPYVTGNVVGGSSAFVGRTDILQAIENNLSHPQQNAIVSYGQRRIGKTSVLKALETQLPQRGYQTIYFDLMGKVRQPLETILSDLAETICQKLKVNKPQGGNTPFHTWLTEIVNCKELSGQSLVLLFDEFDAIDVPQAEQARDAFFHYLREKLLPIEPQKLNFIFAIGRNINDFQSALVLLRTMISYHVSLLTKKETEQLIRLSEDNKSLDWSKSAVKKILELTQDILTSPSCYVLLSGNNFGINSLPKSPL